MTDDASETSWRGIIDDLKAGLVVEIPVADDQELTKKQQQLAKRAERHGFQVEVQSGDGMLRARRVGEVDPSVRQRPERDQDREERRERRQRRREEGPFDR